jgi:ribulose bisphosphate carboxylase small subunit
MIWTFIKKAIRKIEYDNNLRFGNGSWGVLKEMESEILKEQGDELRETRAAYNEKMGEM